MRTKKVNRYYCDFCKKAGCSASAMAKHEKHCTMNPNRVCRFCSYADEKQTPMVELLSVLPSPDGLDPNLEWKPIIDDLYDKANGCPACVFSAIRQKGIHPSITGFDFKSEIAKFWEEENEESASAEMGYVDEGWQV